MTAKEREARFAELARRSPQDLADLLVSAEHERDQIVAAVERTLGGSYLLNRKGRAAPLRSLAQAVEDIGTDRQRLLRAGSRVANESALATAGDHETESIRTLRRAVAEARKQ